MHPECLGTCGAKEGPHIESTKALEVFIDQRSTAKYLGIIYTVQCKAEYQAPGASLLEPANG